MDSARTPRSLLEAVRYFSDRKRCLDYVVSRRWPNGVICPTCGSKEIHFLKNQERWKCKGKHAKRQFSAKVGSIFEDSPIGFDKWLPAVWFLANCKNGISSYELADALKVEQRTAWFMLARIRLAMQESGGKLGGPGSTVEVDESWIGGKARLMNKKRRAKITGHPRQAAFQSGKTVVMGMLERGGRIRTRVVPDVKRKTLVPHLRANVAEGTELHTDAHTAYDMIGEPTYANLGQPPFAHKVVDHTLTYVNGTVHVNGVENFWSCLKRTLAGTYISVEPFHLFRYLDEQAYRFNARKLTSAERFTGVLDSVVGRRLTYAQLTAQPGS